MVFCSDSRTNAGVDQISTYSKMFRFDLGPTRQFVVMTAGNLATTQATIAQMKKDIRENAATNLNTVNSIGEAADYLGEVSRQQQEKHALNGHGFQASFILGGQIAGNDHRIVMIYPEGNHITSSKDIVDLFAELGKVSRKDRGSDQEVLPSNFKSVRVNSDNWP